MAGRQLRPGEGGALSRGELLALHLDERMHDLEAAESRCRADAWASASGFLQAGAFAGGAVCLWLVVDVCTRIFS